MPPRALASAISASLGIALLVHLNMQCMPYFNAIFAACKRGEAPAGIDLEAAQRYHLGFMCPVIRFLEDGAMNEGSRMATASLYNLMAAVVALQAIESTKPGAKLFVRWLAATNFLSAVLAVSVSLPLAWLPSYWLAMRGDAASSGAPVPSQLAGTLVGVALFTAPSVLLLSSAVTPPWLLAAYTCWVASLLLLLPCAGWAAGLLHAALRRAFDAQPGTAESETAQRAAAAHLVAVKAYALLALMLLLHHVHNLIVLLAAPVPLGRSLAEVVARRHEEAWGAAYFLLWDALGLFVGVVAFVGMERGWAAAAQLCVASVLVGPGAALAGYAAQRERRLAAAAAAGGGGGKGERRAKQQ